ncbi:GFA family protein [Sphingopyxis panaciterrae]
MPGPIKGSCLCGKICFVIDGKFGPAGQCHCSRCRKISGTDGNAVFHAAKAGFRWTGGEDNIATYRIPGEEGWLSSFCKTCGSPTPRPTGRSISSRRAFSTMIRDFAGLPRIYLSVRRRLGSA